MNSNSKQHFFNELKKYSTNENLFEKEWIQISKHKNEKHCICGHTIHHYAYVYNIENGHILTIGVGCCKKYGITQKSTNILLLEYFQELGSLFFENGFFDINRDIDFIQYLNNKIDRIQKLDKENLGEDIKFYLREIEVIKQNLEELIDFYHFYCGKNILLKINVLLETLEDFDVQNDIEEKIASLPTTPLEKEDIIHIVSEIVNEVLNEVVNEVENVPTENVENVSTEIIENVPTEFVENVPTEIIENVSTEIIENVPTEIIVNVPTEIIESNNISHTPSTKYTFKNEKINELLENTDKALEYYPQITNKINVSIEIATHYANETTRRLRKIKEGLREIRLGFQQLNENIHGLNKNI